MRRRSCRREYGESFKAFLQCHTREGHADLEEEVVHAKREGKGAGDREESCRRGYVSGTESRNGLTIDGSQPRRSHEGR